MKGNKVARNWQHLKDKLFLYKIPLEYYAPFLEVKRFGVYSTYSMGGQQVNFTCPATLYAKIPASIKVNYIQLTSLITNEQRWRYKIWKEPIKIPLEIIDSIDPKIPDHWINLESKTLHMIEEEKHYGN